MAAHAAWWLGLLLLPACVRPISLHDVCPNRTFVPSLEQIEDAGLLEPHVTMRQGPALMAACDGRHGLEIGGPTPHAKHIYERVASMDNLAQFADAAHGRDSLVDGAPYAPVGARVVGRTVVGDAANLTAVVAPGSYEVLFASHVLEHAEDPLGTLLGWDNILEPGGVLFLILPWKEGTFDRYRAPNTLDQLAQKYVRARADASALEADLEQTLRTIDLSLDWGFPPDSTHDALRNRTLGSPEGREMLHWHTFDFHLLAQLFGCLNYEILGMDLIVPFHQIIVGRKL